MCSSTGSSARPSTTIREGEDEAGADAALEALATALRAEGRSPYIIYLASQHAPYGALGYVRASADLLVQCEKRQYWPDRIFVASGSGHTHAGLLFGLRALGVEMPIEGVAPLCKSPELSIAADR